MWPVNFHLLKKTEEKEESSENFNSSHTKLRLSLTTTYCRKMTQTCSTHTYFIHIKNGNVRIIHKNLIL